MLGTQWNIVSTSKEPVRYYVFTLPAPTSFQKKDTIHHIKLLLG